MAKLKTPKIGDKVAFRWPADQLGVICEPPKDFNPVPLGGRKLPATVTAVYEEFEGRLVDLDVDTGKGVLQVKSAAWRDADDNAGNSWHWPNAAAAAE